MIILRPLLSLLLVAIAAFAAFGFVATFEPNPPLAQWSWRAIYAVVIVGCLAGFHRLWFRTREEG